MFKNTENDEPVVKEEKNLKNEEVLKVETNRKTSYWEGLVHMFRGTVGTGILALPSAYNQAGYIGGTLAIILITYMVNYSGTILAKCQRELALRRKEDDSMTYQGTVMVAFKEGPEKIQALSSFFMKATNFLLVFGQVAGSCTYVIFIATNIKEVMDPYVGVRTLREYIAWCTPFILVTNLVISLKRMAIVSMFGNIVLLSSIGVIFYYITQDLPSINDRNMFGNIEDIPFFVGTIFFASGCITLILPLQNEMKYPNKMTSSFGVLNINAILTGALYIAFGFLGYFKYGSEAKEATVSVNLPQSSVSAKMVQIFLSVSTMTCIAIHNYITVNLIWEDYLKRHFKKKECITQYLLRITIVVITVIGAMVVPNLKVLISVIGIIGQCTLMSTMPTIIHVLTYYHLPSILAYVKKFYFDIIVLSFNIFILVFEISKGIKYIIETIH